jgi:hypothetical protein
MEVWEMGHIRYGYLLMIHMTLNSELELLYALDCGQYIKFVDQAIESALNGAHWVRITSYGPNNLKFRT